MKLEISDLTKTFGTHPAISSITLSLTQCQTLVLIGPSGSGKSTLLRLLGGLEIPTNGWIAFDGNKINFEEDYLRLYRKSLGIVFQSWNLFPHLTALENIVLPLHRVHGMTLEEAQARSLELLKRFALDTHAHKKPLALSGGQVQRIALIRAIAHRPKMLLLDEPTSALDPLMTSEVLELILELKQAQQDLILVTHHLPFARKIADRVLFIAEGKIIEEGHASEIFETPQTRQVQQYIKKVLAL